MRTGFNISIALICCLFLSTKHAYAQKDKPSIPLEYFYADPMKNSFRDLLSKLHFSFSTGYGRTYYRHRFEGFGLIQENGSQPVIFISDVGPGTQYANWFNTIALQDTLRIADFLVNADTAKLGFKSKGLNIPLKLSVHFEFDRFRLGGGLSFEYMRIREFEPIDFTDQITNFQSGVSGAFVRRYFVLGGAKVFNYYEYNLSVDFNVGVINLGRNFNSDVIQRNPYINLGLNFEREMSEYFRLFVRPSVEWKSFNTTIPETSSIIRHTYPSAFINFGAVVRIPELRRCKISNCHAQVDHRHGNLVVRSKMHPIYKKQNPYYGENYPRLIRYKWKNKNKLNPY